MTQLQIADNPLPPWHCKFVGKLLRTHDMRHEIFSPKRNFKNIVNFLSEVKRPPLFTNVMDIFSSEPWGLALDLQRRKVIMFLGIF